MWLFLFVLFLGFLMFAWIVVTLLPYVLIGLAIWFIIDVVRFHIRRKRA